MVTDRQRTLVQTTFQTISPIADDAAVLFYQRLFEIAPELRPMFSENMTEHRRQVMQIIAAAVKGLDRFDQLISTVRDLGRRHVGYGVQEKHYDLYGQAILWALEMGLGAAFTAEVREAWTAVYGVLSTTMKEGAREAQLAAV